MEMQDFLLATISEYENGGLENEEFLKRAHEIYNEYAVYSCPLLRAEHPYLLGIVYSALAPYYSQNIDFYTSIMENALFCFSKVMKTSDSPNEGKCAAIRMLLLMDDNEWVMKGIVRRFRERYCQELYGQTFEVNRVMGSLLARGNKDGDWVYEMDIIKGLGGYCIGHSSTSNHHSLISALEMKRFYELKKSQKYNGRWFLFKYPEKGDEKEHLFNLFWEFITERVGTPYDRRVTRLHYGW